MSQPPTPDRQPSADEPYDGGAVFDQPTGEPAEQHDEGTAAGQSDSAPEAPASGPSFTDPTAPPAYEQPTYSQPSYYQPSYGGAAASTDPYGQPPSSQSNADPYGQPSAADPGQSAPGYGSQQPGVGYGSQQSASDPYGQPSAPGTGSPSSASDPYGQAPAAYGGQPGAGSYGQQPSDGQAGYGAQGGYGQQPYGQPGADAYGGYGQPTGAGDPYGQQQAYGGYGQNPYGSYGQDPYGASGGGGPHPETNTLLILSIVSVVCCGPLAIYTLIKSNSILTGGGNYETGTLKTVRVISIVAICLWIIGAISRLATLSIN